MNTYSIRLTMIPDLKEGDIVRFSRYYHKDTITGQIGTCKTVEIALRVIGIDYSNSRIEGHAVRVRGEYIASGYTSDKDELERELFTHYYVLKRFDYLSLQSMKFGSDKLVELINEVNPSN